MSEEKVFEFLGTTLTTVRVRQRYKNFVSSALLSEVDGVAVVYRSHLWLLILGILLIVGGALMALANNENQGGAFMLSVVFGVFAIAIYYMTREIVMQIHAGEVVIREQISGNRMKDCIEFIDALEEEKRNFELAERRRAYDHGR